MAYNISKFYRNILGLDLRVSDLLRDQGSATEAINVTYRQTGALSKRQGSQLRTTKNTVGDAGLIKFNNVELGTGTITEELLSINANLNTYTTQTYTLIYSGSNVADYTFALDKATGNFIFSLYDDNNLVFSRDCGNGHGASDTTVAQIKTEVDAEASFSMTITDAGSTPMAFTPIVISQNIAASPGTTGNYYTWTTVDTPGTYANPFSAHYAIIENVDFEIASSAQLLDALYIANGYDALHKYDGNRVYKAGLPEPTIPTDAIGSGGSLTYSAGEDYLWKYTFEHTDAKQNVLESVGSSTTSHTTAGGGESRSITMTNLTASSGYGVAEAKANGSGSPQTSVGGATALIVDSGHDLKVGDQVYIDDTAGGSVVKREVTATTATTITVDGAADMTVADNAVISQTKITLWRTKADGAIYYLVKEFINDTSASTTVYDDGIADASIVIDKIEPIKVPALPPKCRYIDVWRGQLVMTGNKESVNTVYYSDFDGESFPVDQSFVTESRLGGGNSGIKSLDNTLFIFKPRSIITCTGDLGTDQFQVDALSDDGVGCVANATIKEIEGVLWFLGKRGIYTVNRMGHVKKSEKIEPKMEALFTEKRAVGHYLIEKDLYMVALPFFTTDASSDKYINNSSSFIMVYDLYRQAWYEWNTLNFIGGIVEYNSEIYMSGASQDPATFLSATYLTKLLEDTTEEGYSDQGDAISFSYKTHWESLGEPSIYKKFLRIKVHSLDGTIGDFNTDKFSLAVTTEHDYSQNTQSSFTLDFSGGALGWGSSAWGTFPWGEGRLTQLTSKLSSKKAKALRTVFANSSRKENILISGYELEVAATYDLQIKD